MEQPRASVHFAVVLLQELKKKEEEDTDEVDVFPGETPDDK